LRILFAKNNSKKKKRKGNERSKISGLWSCEKETPLKFNFLDEIIVSYLNSIGLLSFMSRLVGEDEHNRTNNENTLCN